MTEEVPEAVLDAARRYAADRDWPWLEPVDARLEQRLSERVWVLRTNSLAVGMNARFTVRESDCVVLDAGYLAR